jgi:YlmC/YmxH family sporulation protein
MELLYSELSKRDVINVVDGRCLGRIIDIKLGFPEGRLLGIVVPGKRTRGILKWFDKSTLYIEVRRILKIGGDVILVNLSCADVCDDSTNVGRPPVPPPHPPHNPPHNPPHHRPPKHCGDSCHDKNTLDLSSICDENGRIDVSDY